LRRRSSNWSISPPWGEARATQLLLALLQANEARPAQQDASRLSDADAIVMAELTRRSGQRAS
jgi:hypothetical protein